MAVGDVLSSPVVVVLATGAVSVASAWVAARWQRSHGKELERDRFRHDMASQAAGVRLSVYTALAARVAEAYRAKCNNDPQAQNLVNAAKNYYYDNRFYFSSEFYGRFRAVSELLAATPFDKRALEERLNQFFEAVRDDLLLRDLSESAIRAGTQSGGKAPSS